MTKNKYLDTSVKHAHGCKHPDECFIDTENKILFIIEKKFQQCSGSVCEKIQTAPFKVWQYKRLYPKYDIKYIYCLSSWFKDNCKSELEYLHLHNIKIFCGNDINYKQEIIKYILNIMN